MALFHRDLLHRPVLPVAFAGIAVLGGLSGCNQLTQLGIGVTPIRQVVENPSQHPHVTVRGTVGDQIGLWGRGAYELKDDSGSVWVLTQSGMPTKASTLVVKGSAAEGVAFLGQNLGVTLTEKERL